MHTFLSCRNRLSTIGFRAFAWISIWVFACLCAHNATGQTDTSAPPVVAALRVAEGFKADPLYTVPKDTQGSWVAMCVDPKGRLIVSDQYGKLYRLTLPPVDVIAEPQIETIDLEIGASHGLLYAFDSLYVMVSENRFGGRGLYRVLDTNGDDQFDEVKLLRKIEGGGEHGPHALILSPDGRSITVAAGNHTQLTEIASSRAPLHWGEDHLLPRAWDARGHARGILAPGGWVAKTDPEGKSWELVAHGFRNEFDIAYNREGELFSYDADMEWDLNAPWYRPTRVNHLISGAEFGWRSGTGKWPDYYIDSFGSVVDIGPGSPTGIAFGYGAKFPRKYQNALFISDWSFGKIYAVHMTSDGSSYKGTAEEFITGQPLAVTDIVVNPVDRAMYFAVGGRRTQSALYRVTYDGWTWPFRVSETRRPNAAARARRKLEAFHGHRDPAAVKTVWSYLNHDDRAVRYAARVALEWQNPNTWRDLALNETDPRKAVAALVALARVSSRDEAHRPEGAAPPDAALQRQILAALDKISWNQLSETDQLDLLRAYALAFTRFGAPDDSTRERLAAKFDPHFPAPTRELNTELAPMLVYLQAPSAAAKVLAELRRAPTQEEQIHYANCLRVLAAGWTQPLREEYFRWFLKAANFEGGASLSGFIRNIKTDAVATLTDSEKESLAEVLNARPERTTPLEAFTGHRQLVKEWTVNELTPMIERSVRNGRNFDRGRQLFGTAGCAACHRYDNDGAAVGPDLTGVAGRFSVRDLLESIVEPNQEISDQYGAIVIRKKNGDVVTGRVGNLNGDNLSVIENMFAPNDFTGVNRRDIESIEPSKTSMMPTGLLNSFSQDEIADLTAYLLSRGNKDVRMFR